MRTLWVDRRQWRCLCLDHLIWYPTICCWTAIDVRWLDRRLSQVILREFVPLSYQYDLQYQGIHSPKFRNLLLSLCCVCSYAELGSLDGPEKRASWPSYFCYECKILEIAGELALYGSHWYAQAIMLIFITIHSDFFSYGYLSWVCIVCMKFLQISQRVCLDWYKQTELTLGYGRGKRKGVLHPKTMRVQWIREDQ